VHQEASIATATVSARLVLAASSLFSYRIPQIAGFNVLLALMALPGYWLAIYLIDLPHFGRRRTQVYGFALLAVLYAAIGFLYGYIKNSKVYFAYIHIYSSHTVRTHAGW
jgi:PHS family inorganic phosphate transporter-like MFS transporter